jgi:hypothetical protein
METIHGAELVVLSFPEQQAGAYIGGLLTLATPLAKNWHWLRAEDSHRSPKFGGKSQIALSSGDA